MTVMLLQPAINSLIDVVTYSASCFRVTVTNTEQMPKTVLSPAVALMAMTKDTFIAHLLMLSVSIWDFLTNWHVS